MPAPSGVTASTVVVKTPWSVSIHRAQHWVLVVGINLCIGAA